MSLVYRMLNLFGTGTDTERKTEWEEDGSQYQAAHTEAASNLTTMCIQEGRKMSRESEKSRLLQSNRTTKQTTDQKMKEIIKSKDELIK